MRKQVLMSIVVSMIALLAASSLRAQQNAKISVEGGSPPDDRASARLLYWDNQANTAAGQLAINYGRPVWRKDYEDPAKFGAMTKGKIWRMGSNFWSELYTDVPVTISGKAIAPGFYFVGLERSADGSSWSLAFIDPTKVRDARVDAFDIHKAAVEFTAPMAIESAGAHTAKLLTITLTHAANDINHATLKVTWGNLALSAPVQVTLNP